MSDLEADEANGGDGRADEAIELEIGFHLANSLGCEIEQQLIDRFHHAARWIAARFSLESLQVSISVVDDPTIHRLNREHLDHDWPTDVISFAFESGPSANGEIIASWDTAERLSVAAGWQPTDELVLYVLHGMLHIVGLDDVDAEARNQMRQVEYEYLRDAQVLGYEPYLTRFDDVSY